MKIAQASHSTATSLREAATGADKTTTTTARVELRTGEASMNHTSCAAKSKNYSSQATCPSLSSSSLSSSSLEDMNFVDSMNGVALGGGKLRCCDVYIEIPRTKVHWRERCSRGCCDGSGRMGEFKNGDDIYHGDSDSDSSPCVEFSSEEEMKEWVWQNCKDTLMSAMRVRCEDERTELARAKSRLALLDQIAQVQRRYLQMEKPSVVFGNLLTGLLDLMDSEYGFIGEVKYEEDGTMFLQTHAISNIAWNAATKKFYDDNIESGLKFYNMKTLFGHVMVHGEAVIANDPKTDARSQSGGVPEGHPPLNHFLGIPFFEQGGAQMNGMVGISNKPGGYSQADVEFLEPFVVTCSNLIQAYRAMQENKRLIDTLEEKVVERTVELKLANDSLERANRKIKQTSAAQLEHFACMSHEIRTPLNCIIGLSSLMQGTQLTPMQEDSLGMIVTSGELLLAVVNDVLDYSKLASGNLEIDVKRTNLQETMHAVVHSIEQKASERSVTLRAIYNDVRVPEYINTDNRRLQQILYNLLGNAVKFSKNGGVVELLVELLPAPGEKASFPLVRTDQSGGESGVAVDAAKCPHIADHCGETKDHNSADSAACDATMCPHAVKSKNKQNHTHSQHYDKVPDEVTASEAISRCPFHRSRATSVRVEQHDTRLSSPRAISAKTSSGGVPANGTKEQEGRHPKHILRFVVKDYGKGISKEDFAKIFLPFQQGMLGSEAGGTGLGLAITSKLVRGLNGTISVDSELGKWSEFTLEFPYYGEPADPMSLSREFSFVRLLLITTDEKRTPSDCTFERFNMKVTRFDSFDSAKKYAASMGPVDKNHCYVFLVQEDLFDQKTYTEFAGNARAVLLTFGPNYTVKTSDGHFRSLIQILPSSLMQSIAAHIRDAAGVVCPALLRSPKVQEKIKGKKSYGHIRVLIAEDNLINQKVLRQMLSRLGVTQIDVVDNGKKAVDMSVENHYDIVFMDMQMPVMDGLEACRIIVERRKDGELPKVVFVTANAWLSFEQKASDAGAEGYISKPYNLRQIESFLESVDRP